MVLFNKKNHSLTLPELLSLPPKSVIEFLHEIKVNKYQKIISDSTIPEIIDRLNFMDRVGLGYLCLNRETSSLSGGEAQRIRLAGQLGSNLSGVLYVLDEPSIGLHPVDNQRLIESLRELQQKGNSLIVVEHDQETINQADFLIEIGPKAGEKGGNWSPYTKMTFGKLKSQYSMKIILLSPKLFEGKNSKSQLIENLLTMNGLH